MKFKVLILCFVVATALTEKYTGKYDNINLQEIIENRKILLSYVNCILDKGKCALEARELKENLKEAIETGCEKCTDAQKDGSSTVIRHLIKKEQAIWDDLTAKYDPTGKWRKVYEDRAQKNGIIIPQ